MKRHLLIFTLLTGLLTAPTFAGFDEGLTAYNKGNYAQALKEWKPLAEQGNSEAQNNLGFLYNHGQGVPQDYQKAIAWYRKAAEQNHAGAQFNLGLMYDDGEGVPQDFQKAAAWYRKAAELDVANSQTNLGTLYYKGLGVPKDYVLAYMLFNLGAAGGSEVGNKNRGFIVNEMTPRQIEEAQALTRNWKVGTPLPTKSKTGQIKEELASAEGSAPAPKKLKACNPPTGKTLRYTDNCHNGDCIRTFENGCQKRFQAPYCYDALSGNWTWKPDGC